MPQQQVQRQATPTALQVPQPRSPRGQKSGVQLAEEGTVEESLVRALQARTERVRQLIQAFQARRQQQPGFAAQQWGQQQQIQQAQPQVSVNPFMPPQGPMMQRPQPPQPPMMPRM
jgi:hypothetical protein